MRAMLLLLRSDACNGHDRTSSSSIFEAQTLPLTRFTFDCLQILCFFIPLLFRPVCLKQKHHHGQGMSPLADVTSRKSWPECNYNAYNSYIVAQCVFDLFVVKSPQQVALSPQ
jgi:hypothetical protein